MSNSATKINRYFGKCVIKGCKGRRVTEGSIRGINFCPVHTHISLDWNQLKGRVNPAKECNGICMGATGPSCDCACGGENHGKNLI